MDRRYMLDMITSKGIRSCLVASIDILGYSSMAKLKPRVDMILLNMSLNFCMNGAKHNVMFPNSAKKSVVGEMNRIQRKIKFVHFSDTLICYLPVAEQLDIVTLLAFCDTVSYAVERFFDDGFPVQACIQFGECLYNRRLNYFIGEPFISAHQTAEGLGFAGLVISAEIMQIASVQAFKTFAYENLGIYSLDVPCKDANSPSSYINKRMYCIDWKHFFVKEGSKNWGNKRIENYVIKKFKDHGKQIENDRVKGKIRNTIFLLQKLLEIGKRQRSECLGKM